MELPQWGLHTGKIAEDSDRTYPDSVHHVGEDSSGNSNGPHGLENGAVNKHTILKDGKVKSPLESDSIDDVYQEPVYHDADGNRLHVVPFSAAPRPKDTKDGAENCRDKTKVEYKSVSREQYYDDERNLAGKPQVVADTQRRSGAAAVEVLRNYFKTPRPDDDTSNSEPVEKEATDVSKPKLTLQCHLHVGNDDETFPSSDKANFSNGFPTEFNVRAKQCEPIDGEPSQASIPPSLTCSESQDSGSGPSSSPHSPQRAVLQPDMAGPRADSAEQSWVSEFSAYNDEIVESLRQLMNH